MVSSVIASKSPLLTSGALQSDALSSSETAKKASDAKPSIFQRAWNSPETKTAAKVFCGLAILGGIIALWVFIPALAAPVTASALATIISQYKDWCRT